MQGVGYIFTPIDVKIERFCRDVHGPQRMNPTNFGVKCVLVYFILFYFTRPYLGLVSIQLKAATASQRYQDANKLLMRLSVGILAHSCFFDKIYEWIKDY